MAGEDCLSDYRLGQELCTLSQELRQWLSVPVVAKSFTESPPISLDDTRGVPARRRGRLEEYCARTVSPQRSGR
jgi:hypothetical protein